MDEQRGDTRIRNVERRDLDAIVALSLVAWKDVFSSFQALLGSELYSAMYPQWEAQQAGAIRAVCQDPALTTMVADVTGEVAGFVAYGAKPDGIWGEVAMLAVHPAHQRRGIGGRLNAYALEALRGQGVKLVRVETGGDDAHAPARRAYERAGYTGLPLVRYFQAL